MFSYCLYLKVTQSFFFFNSAFLLVKSNFPQFFYKLFLFSKVLPIIIKGDTLMITSVCPNMNILFKMNESPYTCTPKTLWKDEIFTWAFIWLASWKILASQELTLYLSSWQTLTKRPSKRAQMQINTVTFISHSALTVKTSCLLSF